MTRLDHDVALEITTNDLAIVAKLIDPSLDTIPNQELIGKFLVLSSVDVRGRFMLMSPSYFARKYDHIEDGPAVTLKMLIQK